MIKFKHLNLILIFAFLAILNSCGLYKRSDVADNPVNVQDRVKKNIQEGRGVRFGKGATRGGDFDFASSNPLWRSAVDVLDFVPLTNASYSGGIIITEWFSAENNTDSTNRELKLTVRFMSNEVQTNSLKITVHRKKCSVNQSCNVELFKSRIQDELIASILREATILEKQVKK